MQGREIGRVAVLGALNLDVCGVPLAALRAGDSNPGRVTVSAGGVAHNIARHLARAGVPVSLIAPLGSDDAAGVLRRCCAAQGISLDDAVSVDGPSPVYLCVHDARGDLVAGVNDMSLLERMTPSLLAERLPLLDAAPLVVLDANLPARTIAWLTGRVGPPLLLDPVSGAKAGRAAPVIGRFAAVKPNRVEAEALTGEKDPRQAAAKLLALGVPRVFISLASEGVYYADAHARGRLPAPSVAAASYNGAGDAMTAGIALGLLLGEDTPHCAERGMQAVAAHLLQQGGMLS